MGQIRKIGKQYYIEFYARGLLYSQVAGQTQEQAQKLLDEIERQIAQGETLTIVRHIDLPVFFARFLSEITSAHTAKTIERFTSTIKHFEGFLKKEYPAITHLAQITPVVVESYRNFLVKTYPPRIVNLTLLLLRDVLEFGIKLGFLNDNPSLHVRLSDWGRVRQLKTTPRYLLAKQIFAQKVGLLKAAELLKVPDVARLLYYENLLPINRDDMYNF